MIVKNEEDWIEGALESVRSVVDEIIIADTGCTDRTIARARPFEPKIIDFEWTNDFAEARNRTLAEARHPWILVLDADECIAPRDLPVLLAALQAGPDGYHLVQRNYVSGNQVFGWTPNTGEYEEGSPYTGYVDNPLIRLFRNHPDIQFRGAVHEIVDPSRLPGDLRFAQVPVVIHHYGKVRETDRVAAKQHLYLELGLKKIQQDPSNPKAYFDLGIQYQELQRHAEAVECFERTFAMTKLPAALLYGAISEKHRGASVRALAMLEHALSLGLDTFDVHLELGNVSLMLNQTGAALARYRTCLSMRPDNPVAAFNCGLALRKMNDMAAAEHYYRVALKLDPNFRIAALELAVLLGSGERFSEATSVLEELLAANPDYREARLTLAKTYIQCGRPADALKVLECTSPEDPVARSLIGAAYLQSGDIDAAQSHLEWSVRHDRSLIDARVNLAQIFELRGDIRKAERFRISASALAEGR